MKSDFKFGKVSKLIPIENINKGEIVKGTVRNIQPYGAFIRTDDGVDGLLYIEDISVARIKTPAERLKVGQKIDVVIKDIDKQKNRVYFSYKEMLGTWEDNIKDIQEKTIVQGTVRETEKNRRGIFIEIKPNLIGMAEYKEGLQYGQKVDVYVKKIVKEKKKIKLIIK
ncbi:MAG: S1 RNA-binding domain-containing protein [Clostridia bacterium]